MVYTQNGPRFDGGGDDDGGIREPWRASRIFDPPGIKACVVTNCFESIGQFSGTQVDKISLISVKLWNGEGGAVRIVRSRRLIVEGEGDNDGAEA